MVVLASTTSVVTSGTLVAAVPVALLAGIISFFSPCVLPLIPGYLGYVTGLSASTLDPEAREEKRGRMLLGALLFVIGFSVPFITTGAFFGYFGNTLSAYKDTLNIILGSLTILFGLAFMGFLPGFTQRDFRIHRKPGAGLLGAPVLGFTFGLGWSPCMGPTLGAVMSLSMGQESPGRGALLVSFFCLGLGVPFILTAVAFRRSMKTFGWVKKHYSLVLKIGGGFLIAVGVLLVTGLWSDFVYQLQIWLPASNAVGI
ncbi:cytochrome c biogenesis CcdA family protein [Streptomyces nojiriensis]|uniref:cytochrome c biogenesis CcdA family protein n=1 Tax=Streptomyces nojiriensis TaxID=66374 RepID=UPI00364A538E